MHNSFKKKFTRLQRLLQQYEAELANVTNEQANKNSETGGWSILEIVYHVSQSERGIIKYIQKSLLKPQESKVAGLKSFYRYALLWFALKSKRKYRAPKVLEEPKGPYEKEKLMEGWKMTRVALEETIKSVPLKYIHRQLFRHPVVGGINIEQTIGFMGDHLQRHLEQIKKIKG